MTWVRLCVLVLATSLAGCQTVGGYYDRWFGTPAPAAKPAELAAFTATVNARVVWSATTAAADRFAFAPAIAAGRVFATGASGAVTALELASGKVLWRSEAGARVAGGVGADERIAVVGTPRGEVIALDTEGRLLWKALVSSEISSVPKLEEGLVIVRSGDGRIHALGASDGKRRWTYQRSLPPLVMRSPAGVTVERGGVFVGFPGGKLVALSLSSGVLGWEATVSSPRGSTELERIADIVGAPAVEGATACAVSFQGRIACFDVQRGSVTWARELSSLVPLSMDARLVFASDDKQAVHAFDRGSGSSVWKQDKLAGRGITGPQVTGRYVVVGDYQGYVHLLNRDDGSFAARISTDGSPVLSQPVVTAGGVLVQTRNGGVFMIGIP